MIKAIFNGGRSGVSVGSAAEVDLLNENSGGLTISGCNRWSLSVEVAGADITLRVYLYDGENCGFVELTELTATVSAGSTHNIVSDSCSSEKIKVTGRTGSGTATVSCDFRGF